MTEITIVDMFTIGSVLLLYWVLYDIYKEIKKSNQWRVRMEGDTQASPAPEQEEVKLNFFVPQIENWEDLNKLLAGIGAIVILTEDKTLEDVGHNPEHWRQLSEEEKESYASK